MSFRRFCGFSLSDRTPDETTICRFRHEAAEAGAMQTCFAEIVRQLEEQKIVLRQGTIMDASIIRARHNPPPISEGPGARHSSEPEADWTHRNGRPVFGYKAHVGLDESSGLVRRMSSPRPRSTKARLPTR